MYFAIKLLLDRASILPTITDTVVWCGTTRSRRLDENNIIKHVGSGKLLRNPAFPIDANVMAKALDSTNLSGNTPDKDLNDITIDGVAADSSRTC